MTQNFGPGTGVQVGSTGYRTSGPPRERTGFEDYTEVKLSWDRPTRTATITPVGTSYTVWHADQRRLHTAVQSIAIPDTEGLHVIYFDSTGALVSTTTWNNHLITGPDALVTFVYWDATNKREILDIFFECHGKDLDGEAHLSIHLDRGTSWRGGLTLSDVLVDQSGALDTHAQFGVALGKIADEDLPFDISTVLSTTGLPILALDGATPVLREYSQPGFSVLTDVTAGVGATGRLVYNQLVGAAWQLTVVPNTDYVLCHVFAANANTDSKRMYCMLGQATYGNKSAAREGAITEIENILELLPIAERKPIATVIYQTRDAYANAAKARTISTDAGDDYIDWRRTGLSSGGGTSIPAHNSTSARDALACHPATSIAVDASGFSETLSAADVNCQLALAVLDTHLHTGQTLAAAGNSTNWAAGGDITLGNGRDLLCAVADTSSLGSTAEPFGISWVSLPVLVTGQNAMIGAGYDAYPVMFRTGSTGAAPYDNAGSLIIRPRVSATIARSTTYFYNGSPSAEVCRIDETGLQLANTKDLKASVAFGSDIGTANVPFGTMNFSNKSQYVVGSYILDRLYRYNGTWIAPTKLLGGDAIHFQRWAGRHGAAGNGYGAEMYIYTRQNWDDAGKLGTAWNFYVTDVNDATPSLYISLDGSSEKIILSKAVDAQQNITLANTIDLLCATAFGSDLFSATIPGGTLYGGEHRSYTIASLLDNRKQRANGTWATPTKVLNNDYIEYTRWYGYHGGGGWGNAAARAVICEEDFDDANSLGTTMNWYVTKLNSSSLSVFLGLDGSNLQVRVWENLYIAAAKNIVCATDGTSNLATTTVRFADAFADNHVAGRLNIDNVASPAQITAGQNDYNPTGLDDAGVLRLNFELNVPSFEITGITAPTTNVSGKVLYVVNVGGGGGAGSHDGVLKNDDANSAAANRMILGGDITLVLDGPGVALWYDSTSSRWRLLSNV